MKGSKVILHCKYFKKGSDNKAALQSLVKYIATRDGVQKFTVSEENRNLFPTSNQLDLIKSLEKKFGLGIDLPEFEDYVKRKTQHSASEYISAIIDSNLNQVMTKKNLVEYIGKRPGADRGELDHGLFCISDNGIITKKVNIDAVMEEVSNHPGRVWTNVLSLRREDAQAAGYEDKDKWADLLRAKVHDISTEMNIPLSHLKAYGAFHDETHHPHCHFIIYSSKPGAESLYRKGIEKLKSTLAHGIFTQQMLDVAKAKGDARDELRYKAKEEIKKLTEALENKGFSVTTEAEMRLINLAKKLPKRGKKMYQLLPKDIKRDVIEIVDLLEQQPEIAELYEKWKTYHTELSRFYKEKVEFPKLSENDTFRPVLNAVVREAWEIRQWLDSNLHDNYTRCHNAALELEAHREEAEKPIRNAYNNILFEMTRSFGKAKTNTPIKHFDSTMDKKHQEEQRKLKKRLGLKM